MQEFEAAAAIETLHPQVIEPAVVDRAGVKVAVVAAEPLPTEGLTKIPVVSLQLPVAGIVTFVHSAVLRPC